jgi:hypothetical protein
MNQREQFEAWAKSKYVWSSMWRAEREAMWEIWQAAQAQHPEAQEQINYEVHLTHCNMGDAMLKVRGEQ